MVCLKAFFQASLPFTPWPYSVWFWVLSPEDSAHPRPLGKGRGRFAAPLEGTCRGTIPALLVLFPFAVLLFALCRWLKSPTIL
ncbi:MAG: hypothetical protein ACKPKO_55630, partial [Candidatus Fonsibacter sp.]